MRSRVPEHIAESSAAGGNEDSLAFDAPSVFESWLGSVGGGEASARRDHAAFREHELAGFCGSEMVMRCDASFHGTLQIDGYLAGKIASEDGTLIVGRDGRVDASITVAVAIIDGEVNGDVVASDRIELGSEARVIGNLSAASLSIERGAILEGNCHFRSPRSETLGDFDLVSMAASSL